MARRARTGRDADAEARLPDHAAQGLAALPELTMRTSLTSLGLSTLAAVASLRAPASAHAAASGEIDSVLVFADRARVTRARDVACEKGTARAVVDRLPATLDVRTLRGEVREAAEVIGLSGEQVNEREAADPRARALAADLDKIDNDI